MTTPLEQFKSTIISIRDILRKGGITGMDSMKHCTLYITARYMSAERCAQFEIPAKFAWETIIETSRKKGVHIQVSRDLIYNVGGSDCLVNHFDTLFKTTEFLFRVEADEHYEIMEKIASIELDSIHLETDLLGWVYEQHLKKGSSSARDLGQFFTDRSITTYMTTLCNPKRSETICDPTMGTGGFLTSALHYLQTVEKLTDAEIRASKDKFHGFDIDKFVSSVASINMFIESHGTVFPNIVFRDSLAKGAIVPYDVILANMPFGVKGLTYARCHESVKALHLDGTKSEPLFLQWMMVNLNTGGRCAVVVPDGMNVNNSKCHNETRKYLLDNFELKRVIKMKGQFFMNTGIQPSILFFENTGKPTTTVEFWDTEKNADGSIKEDLILSVARTAMDETYSFDMRHYQTVDAVENPAGFAMMKLEDIVNALPGENLSPEETEAHPGAYEVVSGGKIPTKTYHKYNREGNQISISKFGSYAGFVRWNKHPFWSLGSFTLIPIKDVICSMKYLYYYLSIHNDILYKYQRKGPTTNFYWSDVKSVIIPLPPLPIQEKIVEDLDLIYQNADFAKKSANFVKQQMAAVMQSVSARGFERKKLSEICVLNPENISKSEKLSNIHYIDLGSVKEGIISEIQTIPFSEKPDRAQRKVKQFDILWGTVRPLSKSYAFLNTVLENTIVSTGFAVIRKKDSISILPKYMYYMLTTNECVQYLSNKSGGSSYPAFRAEILNEFEIPIPPLPIQAETLAIMNEMEAELKMLEQMAAKAESRARYILDGYLSTSATEEVEKEEAEPPSTTLIHEPLSLTLTHESPIPLTKPDYNAMSKPELLEQCKNNNIKGVSNKKKDELIKLLEAL